MDRAGVSLAQGFAQDRPQRRQAGAGGQQPQRTLLPFRFIAQRAALQAAQAQGIARTQPARVVTEAAPARAVDMKLQERILPRQVRQRVGAGKAVVTPQQQVLAGLVAQRDLGCETQAQHLGGQPVVADHLGRQRLLGRIEQLDAQVLAHPALAGQSPAGGALAGRQGVGPGVQRFAVQTAHPAGAATAGAAAVRHGLAGLEQGIEQVATGLYRPVPVANREFGHDVEIELKEPRLYDGTVRRPIDSDYRTERPRSRPRGCPHFRRPRYTAAPFLLVRRSWSGASFDVPVFKEERTHDRDQTG